ncbi:MAG TPA: glycoside hydrolase family 44 protein [Polyangiaceae bacterium]|nr:glycoside hydrolase family 44 protein [Polyangiaceae bacterium]
MSAKKVVLLAFALAMSLVAGMALKISRRPHPPKAAASGEPVDTGPRTLSAFTVAESVYDGKLSQGWSDWGWGRHDLTRPGPAKVVFGGYGGIIFRHLELDSNFGALSFRYKAPEDWPEFLRVALRGGTSDKGNTPNVQLEARHVAQLPGGWREALIDFSELNPEGLPFERIVISANSPVGSDWILIDKVVLVKAGAQTPPARRNAQLSILCRAQTHVISPLIYGSANGDWTSGQTSQRAGGNPMSRYNWDLNTWNAGNDWFFENGKGVDLNAQLDDGLAHGALTAVTVPIIGWVAKDATSFGFPRSRFPKQRKFDEYRPDAGDGYQPDGSPLQPGPPTETSVAAPPELIGRWVRGVHERDHASGKRRVQMYILDNEPSLWDVTHRDVHPKPLGYDELMERTLSYASEVRKADPEALIAGPAEWGWMGYMYSGRDRVAGKQARPDRLAHGDVPLIPYYLSKIAEREKASNQRLLDVLDVHFYPTPDGLYGAKARTDPEGAALRLRSTRALWDPTYVDESWINEPIKLIPRLKEWVATYHPGLMISLGEWSFGADQHISGGLATAEALGRFGQQGLDAAYYWGGPAVGTATFWGFRAFRNFDGKGGRFQDIALTTTEHSSVSLFASRNETNSKLVAVLVNRDPKVSTNVRIALDGCAEIVAYRVFRYVSGSEGLTPQPSGTIDRKYLTETLPPYSLSVLDVDTQ